MKINAFTCNSCGSTIYSRTTHDFNTCPCWNKEQTQGIFIDGGFDYTRYGGNGKQVTLYLPLTEKDLYDDWNSARDKYGIIKAKP